MFDKTVDNELLVNLVNAGTALTSIDPTVVGAVAVTTKPSREVISTAAVDESTVELLSFMSLVSETVPPAVAKPVALLIVMPVSTKPLVLVPVAV